MHGPPLTIDEIAALLGREVAALTRLGAGPERVAFTLAERHRIPLETVERLVARDAETQRHGEHQAAA